LVAIIQYNLGVIRQMGYKSRLRSTTTRRRVPLLGLLIGAIALIALASLVYLAVVVASSFSGEERKEVVVPTLLGMDVEKAESILSEINLGLKVRDSAYSDEYRAGTIIWQTPPPEQKVREGRVIEVIESLGKPSFIVPKVVGMSLERAQKEIISAHLLVGEVRKIFSKSVDRGTVVTQSPEPLRTFPSPVKVDIVVADFQPSDVLLMPDVKNIPLSKAEEILLTNNLLLSKVEYVSEGKFPAGTVISQEPEAGKTVELGSKVNLRVERGEEIDKRVGRTFYVHFRMPPILPGGVLTITVEDAHGVSEVLRDEISPGGVIEQTVTTEGPSTIRIYLDGKLLREDTV